MKKNLEIVIERYLYTVQTSIGKIFLEYDSTYITDPPTPIKLQFGYTLEDTIRPDNIKVYAETGLPGGLVCKVRLYESSRHGKTIIFYTEDDGVTIKWGPLSWTYVLAHGGNTHIDTAACILVARNVINDDRIQGSLKDELRKFIEKKIDIEGYTVTARFVNLTQTGTKSREIIYKINFVTVWNLIKKYILRKKL